MTSTYIWLILLLKVPAIGFVWLVWRALRNDQQPLPAGDGDGGGGAKLRFDPHPRPRAPRRPRRGPHGAAPLPAPSRVRHVSARACTAQAQR
jgi:hypothetical protein